MSDTAASPALVLFLLALIAAVCTAFFGCRWILESHRLQHLPRPIVCAALWALPSALLLLSTLPLARHPRDLLEVSPLLLVIALLGLCFGGIFRLLTRSGIKGYWYQRAFVGALVGLAVAVACGAMIHHFLTGWGGPGGGGFRRLGIPEATLLFSWFVPLLAVLGIATPLRAVMPDPFNVRQVQGLSLLHVPRVEP